MSGFEVQRAKELANIDKDEKLSPNDDESSLTLPIPFEQMAWWQGAIFALAGAVLVTGAIVLKFAGDSVWLMFGFIAMAIGWAICSAISNSLKIKSGRDAK